MTDRRLLYLNTHRLSAYSWRRGQLSVDGVFDADEEGRQAFAAYLAEHKPSHFSLLANVAEESHVVETIPFLQGSDRRTLLTRKIGQHFFGTSLATATSLGYEKNQRKNEKLLLSALTDPAHFEPWLQRIDAAEASLVGIYTVAQLGGLLLRRLGQDCSRCLLLSMQDHSIRESYLVNGHAYFSRMAPLTDSSIAGVASAFAAESGKLHQYLIGQRLIGRDDVLPVFVIGHPQALPAIEKACPDQGQLNFTLIDSHLAAAKLKLRTPPNDNRSDPLFLHLLALSPPAQQFAGEPLRHHYRISQIRHGLIAAGLVALLGSVLFAAKETYDAQSLRDEARALSANEADLNRRFQEFSASFPQLGLDNESLRRLTGRYGELAAQQRHPGPAYRAISQVLDRMPAIALDELDWKNGQNSRFSVTKPADSREVTTIRGSIRLDRATPRQILTVFDEFVAALRSDGATEVNVLQRPLDLESSSLLRGGDGQEDDSRPRQFAVEVIRTAKP